MSATNARMRDARRGGPLAASLGGAWVSTYLEHKPKRLIGTAGVGIAGAYVDVPRVKKKNIRE